jgi:hypothetical protein
MNEELKIINKKLASLDKYHFCYGCMAFYEKGLFLLKRNKELVLACKSANTIKIQIGF